MKKIKNKVRMQVIANKRRENDLARKEERRIKIQLMRQGGLGCKMWDKRKENKMKKQMAQKKRRK